MTTGTSHREKKKNGTDETDEDQRIEELMGK